MASDGAIQIGTILKNGNCSNACDISSATGPRGWRGLFDLDSGRSMPELREWLQTERFRSEQSLRMETALTPAIFQVLRALGDGEDFSTWIPAARCLNCGNGFRRSDSDRNNP